MSLAPGVRLGPYEILNAIGVGGMGEVYRARDTKLDRYVAIKVLPDAFASDHERVARFEREAKTLASLNHPNIAAIHGVEEAESVKALVLEFIEGPTLADRLARGPMPIDAALAIAKQIADALEAAHEQGIVHRDLKPANIKLRPDDTVKLLDFGLAKPVAAESSSVSRVNLTNSPTISSPITISGIVTLLGTAAYMAPEQARGRPVDKRADIWAFGCVVYEMLTGRPPFAGNDMSEVLAGVIKSDPAWEQLPSELPPVLRKVLQRCLHKDPKQRLRDIGDARLALDGAFETAVPMPAALRARQPKMWQRPLAAVAVAALLVAATGVTAWNLASRDSSAPAVRRMVLNVAAPAVYDGLGLAISPDGAHVVFAAGVAGGPQLFLRSLDQLHARPLAGTEDGRQPFFSPDGQSIAFFNDHGAGASRTQLQKISLRGGSPQTLADAPYPRGGSWNEDGTIIFASGATAALTQLMRTSANGGAAAPVSESSPVARGWPQLLPGGKRVLFTAYGSTPHLEVLSLDTGESRVIIENGHSGRYLPTGHILYVSNAALTAVPFDIDRLDATGPAATIIDGVRTLLPAGITSVAAAADGTLIYQPGLADVQERANGTLVVVNRDGRASPVGASRGSEVWPRLSPDESQVGVFSADRSSGNTVNTDVWVYDLHRGTRDRITTDPAEDSYFAWSRDGSRFVFLSARTGTGDLYSQSVDGSTLAELLVTDDTRKIPTSWSRDGKVLAFHKESAQNLRDVWTLAIGGTPQPFLATPADEMAATFSPNGRLLAYVSDESGERQVYVQPYPGPGRRIPVSIKGGEGPVWRLDGSELFYFRARNRTSGELMAVAVKTAPTVTVGEPTVVFEGPYLAQVNGNANYDVFRDGKRFVMIQADRSTSAEPPFVVVLNWFEELKRLVPTD